jgi:hypothetical protein
VKVLSSEERITATSTSPTFWTDFGVILRENTTEKSRRGFIYPRRMVLDLYNAIVICLGPVVMVEVKQIANLVYISSCSRKVVCSFVHFSSCSHKVVCSFGERFICNCTCCELVKQNFAVAVNVRMAPDSAHHLQKPLSISSISSRSVLSS